MYKFRSLILQYRVYSSRNNPAVWMKCTLNSLSFKASFSIQHDFESRENIYSASTEFSLQGYKNNEKNMKSCEVNISIKMKNMLLFYMKSCKDWILSFSTDFPNVITVVNQFILSFFFMLFMLQPLWNQVLMTYRRLWGMWGSYQGAELSWTEGWVRRSEDQVKKKLNPLL